MLRQTLPTWPTPAALVVVFVLPPAGRCYFGFSWFSYRGWFYPEMGYIHFNRWNLAVLALLAAYLTARLR